MRLLAGGVMAGLVVILVLGSAAVAQDGVPPPAPVPQRPPDQLDQLVAPLALYPDPLAGQIMAAATFPDQIVVADRDLSQGMSVDDLAQQGLDPSVQGLAHYSNLLKWMDDNLQWTTQLGQAYASQQSDVMDAIQRLRAKAQSLGNLQSTPQETVDSDDGDIEIEPTDPDEIYVPQYDPNAIYYDSGVYCSFGIGLPVGLWLGYDWDWHHHHAIFWDSHHPRPHDWWSRPVAQRHDFASARVWHPNLNHAAALNGDRGYEHAVMAPARAVAAPSHAFAVPARAGEPSPRTEEAPRAAEVPREAPRTVEVPHEAAPPIERAPETSSRGYTGMFGGNESARETETFSSRGSASRGVTTPVESGSRGGGGGGGSRGGGQRH